MVGDLGANPVLVIRRLKSTEEPSETRLFDAAESYVERDAARLLASKNKAFVDHDHSASDDPCPVLTGDVVPYHARAANSRGALHATLLAKAPLRRHNRARALGRRDARHHDATVPSSGGGRQPPGPLGVL